MCSSAVPTAREEPQEPADLGRGRLLYSPQWQSSPQPETHRRELQPADRDRDSQRGSNQYEARPGRSSDARDRARRRQHETEPDRKAGTEETDHEGRIRWRATWKQPDAGRRRQHGDRNNAATRGGCRREKSADQKARLERRTEIDNNTANSLEERTYHDDRDDRRVPRRSRTGHGRHAGQQPQSFLMAFHTNLSEYDLAMSFTTGSNAKRVPVRITHASLRARKQQPVRPSIRVPQHRERQQRAPRWTDRLSGQCQRRSDLQRSRGRGQQVHSHRSAVTPGASDLPGRKHPVLGGHLGRRGRARSRRTRHGGDNDRDRSGRLDARRRSAAPPPRRRNERRLVARVTSVEPPGRGRDQPRGSGLDLTASRSPRARTRRPISS